MGTLSSKYPNSQAVEAALDKGVEALAKATELKEDLSEVDTRLSESITEISKNKADYKKIAEGEKIVIPIVSEKLLGIRSTSGNVNDGQTYFERYDITYNEGDGESIIITGRSGSNGVSFPAVIFWNGSSVLDTFGTTASTVFADNEVAIPVGTTSITVNNSNNRVCSLSASFVKESEAVLWGLDDAYDAIGVAKEFPIIPTKKAKPLETILQDGGFCRIFKSIHCIGDSLTEGFFNTSTINYIDKELSYPSQLSKLTGAIVQNCGSSGCTASNYDNSHGWIRRANLEQNKFWDLPNSSAYIIALGTNDCTTTQGFDGVVPNDLEDTTKSVGGYAEIIRLIRERQPKAKIFCVTIPLWRNSSGDQYTKKIEANEKIRALAEHYGCYIVDLANDFQQNINLAEWRSIYVSGSHCNALGYLDMAFVMSTYIDYIIRNNPNDFRDVQFIGTDYLLP